MNIRLMMNILRLVYLFEYRINLEESLQGLMLYKKDIVSRPDIISTTSIIDLDNDGKGEM
jgi:hypothetical protein